MRQHFAKCNHPNWYLTDIWALTLKSESLKDFKSHKYYSIPIQTLWLAIIWHCNAFKGNFKRYFSHSMGLIYWALFEWINLIHKFCTSDGSTDLLILDTNSISVNMYHFRQCGQSAHLQRLKHIWMELKPKRKAVLAVISVKYRLLNIRFIHLNLLSKMYIFLQINAMN